MSGHIGRYTNTDRDFILSVLRGEREDMYGPMPGEIVSYDAGTQTATVRPLFSKRRVDGTPLPLPDLEDVPVDVPRGSAGGITFPIQPGDRVTLTPSMRSSEGFDTGEDDTDDVRSFNLSDMRASINGGDPSSSPLSNVDTSNIHIRAGGSGNLGIRISPDGKFAIEGATGNVYTLIASALRALAGAKTEVDRGSSEGEYEHDQKAAVLAIADLLDGMAL